MRTDFRPLCGIVGFFLLGGLVYACVGPGRAGPPGGPSPWTEIAKSIAGALPSPLNWITGGSLGLGTLLFGTHKVQRHYRKKREARDRAPGHL